MQVNETTNPQETNDQSANNHPQNMSVSYEASVDNNHKPKLAIVGIIVLTFVMVLLLFTKMFKSKLRISNQETKQNLETSSSPTKATQVEETGNTHEISPTAAKTSCADKARFSQTTDNLEDKLDPSTQWKKHTNTHTQISMLYPPHLIQRNNHNSWVYPLVDEVETAKEVLHMEFGNYYSAFNVSEDRDRLQDMEINEEVTLNQGLDAEYKVKKIGEKTEGNFSGSIYKTIIDEIGYWHPTYSYVFVSNDLIRDKKLILTYGFTQEVERDKAQENFFKIVNSLEFEDYDTEFIRSLSFLNTAEQLSLVDDEADGGVYHLRKPTVEMDSNQELFQLEGLRGEQSGYVVSRTVCLNDLVGKRMIMSLRKIEGATINGDNVYLVDDVNVI